jgi:hypothetical protein
MACRLLPPIFLFHGRGEEWFALAVATDELESFSYCSGLFDVVLSSSDDTASSSSSSSSKKPYPVPSRTIIILK